MRSFLVAAASFGLVAYLGGTLYLLILLGGLASDTMDEIVLWSAGHNTLSACTCPPAEETVHAREHLIYEAEVAAWGGPADDHPTPEE